jgi:hypothetical protein
MATIQVLDGNGVLQTVQVPDPDGRAAAAASKPMVLSNEDFAALQANIPVRNAVNGTLSASDAVVAAPIGDGTLISGASTAGSIVFTAVPDGAQTWILLIKGYASGTIYTEASFNSTNGTDGDWVEVKGRRTGTAPGTESVVYAMVANGYYRGNCSGFTYVRARLIGGTGPTIGWSISSALGPTFLNSGIPAGSSSIGTVVLTAETTKVIGTINIAASQTVGLVAGAAVIGGVTQSGTWNIGSITTLPALVAGSAIIGKVGIDQTTPGTTNLVSIGTNGTVAINAALPTGANVIGALAPNQSVNNTQINGVALLAGNGVTGTGSQRVTIASDNTAFSVIATQTTANATTGDTGAKTATGNGATQTNAGAKGVQVLIVMGVVSGTTPTFVGKVQGSVDGGTTWYDIPGAATASLTATGNFGILIYPGIAVTAGTTVSGTTATSNMGLPRTWRVVWTIGGTTPSFTITAIQYNYLVN